MESVGKALVSTWLRASVMQYSEVSPGKNDPERVVSNRGTLLIKNDRSMVVVCTPSPRDVAFARTSNEARIRSIAVDRTSPCFRQYVNILSCGMTLPDIDYVGIQILRYHQ